MDLTELKLAGPAVRHLIDYDVNGNAIYEGYAAPGTDPTAPRWFILKHFYDVSNKYLETQSVRNAVYADRTILSFS